MSMSTDQRWLRPASGFKVPGRNFDVFDENEGAVRLYERYGYREIARLPVVPHPIYPYDGDVVLMTRSVAL